MMPVLIGAFVVGVLAGITRITVQPEQARTLARVAPQASGTFTEDFTSVAKKDAVNTTMDWNTAQGVLRLAKASGTIKNLDLTTTGAQNITNTPLEFESALRRGFVIDSNDRPMFVYLCTPSGVSSACFSRWDGTQMVRMNGTPGSEVVNNDPTLSVIGAAIVLNPTTEQPCVAYAQIASGFVENLELACWDGSGWGGPFAGAGTPDVLTTGTTYVTLSIDVGTDGKTVVSWRDGSSDDVYVLRQTDSGYAGYLGPGPDLLTAGGTTFNVNGDLVLDSGNEPHLVYMEQDFDASTIKVYYTQFSSGAYRQLDGTTAGRSALPSAGSARSPSMRLTNNDRPKIVFEEDDQRVMYTQWDGASLTDANGVPGSQEILTGNFDAGSVIALNSADQPTVCAEIPDDIGDFAEVYCTAFNSTGWTSPVDLSTPGALNLTSTPVTYESNPAIAFDSYDDLVFAYKDEDVEEILAGVLLRPLVEGVAQSTVVAETPENIVSATLSSPDVIAEEVILGGGSIVYGVSNDGGATFVPATLGTPVIFTTSGSSLVWKLTATRNPINSRLGPTLSSLVVNYQTSAAPGGPERIGGATPIEQAINTSRTRFSNNQAHAAVVSREDNIVDSLVGAPLASATEAPILLTHTNSLAPEVLAELQRVLRSPADPVFVLGKEKAISETVVAALKTNGFSNVVRLGDSDRRGTAVTIGDYLVAQGFTGTEVALTEDQRFTDTLGFSAVAANRSNGNVTPIVLTERAAPTLNAFARGFLERHDAFTTLEILGGAKAVAAGMEATLKAIAPNLTTVTRDDGVDRFDTNARMARAHFSSPAPVVVAGGERASLPGARSQSAINNTEDTGYFFAALLGGTLAADQNAPLVVVRALELPDAIRSYLTEKAVSLTNATIVGNVDQVSDAVANEIQTIITAI